ncbi:flagellar biosynthesis protein FlhA [Halomonas sp. FeN2]|jgi:flagellar biosynthesis protein FlhA|uniref:flagellar biosynthesis protein FlhA n=1 Tax=Halomonadaceae TaxID=28256 RepID=UPI000C6902E3|nr:MULTISPECIES: flagellar biosynthesis protein FlhA [unclassified Halomonas]TDV89899.1 flagellar biosynthesis protein FlhA [Halomonas alkaliantarctica]MBF58971.1 flagellar biosynthesis protein FlhA [Halomonas sp.]MBL1270090.1 flagellar biosynthesis protein FlhA [Halomonas sp.]MBL1270685.1 flagellar biosynthesis protein FlhA [Halomonas sp.]UBR48133.1 flagellar biosynthesis protein FlhA [Halomonas sp. FeN2]|tara:strand:- start:5029 stop:7116 length:2088 start_codon:yes stop_codon:yes gene_type:complete
MKGLSQLVGRRDWMGDVRMKLLVGPLLILMILGMMIVPLPPFALDLLFTFNIALAIMVLMVSMFTQKPLDFAAFPAVLLFTTLLRLSLNVASTRVVLMEGHQGGASAGKVIEAFGAFLVGGNFAVGLVVFLILVIINFMVITKGAGRIAEVGARFTLDAMPGKQMAIDADLNAGLIGEEDAKKRRAEVAQEADFFGSMDGASKFVRGDAIAGLVIMVVNIIGGLLIGMLQHDMSFGAAGQTYMLLAIGDGLVAQIPALVISTAAGVTVSRVSTDTDEDIGQQMLSQLFVNPQVLILAAIVMGLLGMVPGMPNLVFLLFTALLAGLAWFIMRQKEQLLVKEEIATAPVPLQETPEASWEDVQLVDTLGLEVGHRLIPLVDSRQKGELLGRIKSVRKKFAQEVGFLPPVVHIRDNLELPPNAYVLSMKGAEIGRAEAQPGKWLAINPGQVSGELQGTQTQDPAFGLPAVWIDSNQREHAQVYGYTVVDASTVIATHLNHLLHRHSPEMLGRQEVQKLLDKMGDEQKALVEEVIPKAISLTVLQRILQNLLDEDVSIRDMRTILDTLAEYATQQKDPNELTALVRVSLGRAIVQQWFAGQETLNVMGLDAQLEQVLVQAMNGNGAMEPGLAETLMTQAQQALERHESSGEPPVLVVQHSLRAVLSRFLRRRLRHMSVLSQAEIPDDRTLRVTTIVGGR